MSFLAQAKKPLATPHPPMITIVGSPGTGKTSLGGLFPAPIFVQAENSQATFESWDEDVQPTLLPLLPKSSKTVSTHETLMEQLRELATADHGFQTLVIDSITSLSEMLEEELATRYEVATVADAAGGFHKGYLELAALHSEIIYACDVIRKRKNMTIVFLAHVGIDKIKSSPDESSEYAVYGLDMHKKSAALYTAQCDAVLYLTKERHIVGAETNKKGQTTKFGRVMETGDRILITNGDGKTGYVAAKNRYNMPSELPCPLGENPITSFIRFFNNSDQGE